MEFARFQRSEWLPQQRELFNDAFPENRGTPAASVDHYRWKFQRAPFDPPSYEYAVTEAGNMLGYYAAIPYQYEIADRAVTAGMVCDVMTHSQARGRGVFTDLGRFALKEMEASGLGFVTGYPVRPGVIGGHLRAGWSVAFELPMYLRPLRATAILKSKRLSWLAPLANAGIAAYEGVCKARPRDSYEVSVGAPGELFRSPAFKVFVERWSTSVPNHLVKSVDFYDWRLSAPGTDYQAFLVQQRGVVVAAAVGRESLLHGIPAYALLDLMVLNVQQEALAPLYHEIDREARRRGVEAIVTMMSRCRAREYHLMRFGFLKSPFTFKLIVRTLSEELSLDEIAAEDRWHLMWIDSDDL